MTDPNQRFAELAGLCWHEQVDNQTLKCKHCGQSMLFQWQGNPDFTDAREVLKVMRVRENWIEFSEHLFPGTDPQTEIEAACYYILDTTGKLRDAAIEWMEEKR